MEEFFRFILDVIARVLAHVLSEKLIEKVIHFRSRRQSRKVPRLLLIVSRHSPELDADFKRVFANDPVVADVILDRRLDERRRRDASPRFDRRNGVRREFPVDRPLLQRGFAFAPARNI